MATSQAMCRYCLAFLRLYLSCADPYVAFLSCLLGNTHGINGMDGGTSFCGDQAV